MPIQANNKDGSKKTGKPISVAIQGGETGPVQLALFPLTSSEARRANVFGRFELFDEIDCWNGPERSYSKAIPSLKSVLLTGAMAEALGKADHRSSKPPSFFSPLGLPVLNIYRFWGAEEFVALVEAVGSDSPNISDELRAAENRLRSLIEQNGNFTGLPNMMLEF